MIAGQGTGRGRPACRSLVTDKPRSNPSVAHLSGDHGLCAGAELAAGLALSGSAQSVDPHSA